MPNDLRNEHVVVTGGSGALGRAVVARMLDDGATVHVPCFEGALDPALDWPKHERVQVTTSVDLADEGAVLRFYEALPPIWASIHCAGGFAMSAVDETSLADFDRMFKMNAVSSFLSCREAVRSMRRGGRGGRIVNVAARPALEAAGGLIAYSSAKAAVASMTECLARELVADGILVNAVVPAMIDTPANRAAMPAADHASWPRPAELAEVIAFAASRSNTVTSGALLPVYGKLM